MRIRNFFLILSLLSAGVAKSQNLYYETYDWKTTHEFPETISENKIILQRKEVIEFAYNGEEFIEYDLWHEIELINSDEEIELNNKKYIPYRNGSEVIIAKARVIRPNKEEIILEESKILTSFNEQSGQYFKYFAFEGLQKGCIIEHFYVIKKEPDYYGAYTYAQTNYPIRKYEFELLAPENLIFKFNVLNDTSVFQQDTTIAEKNRWYISFCSVPALKPEENSPYNHLLIQIAYKLDENTSSGTKDISSFERASQNIYRNVYNNYDKSDLKALKKFSKKIKIKQNDPLPDKIKNIEDYIKNNINVVNANSPELSKISSAIPNKAASIYGMTRIFAAMFTNFGVEHQLVVTSDRTKLKFNPEFESFHYLTSYLFYFPETDKYLIPDAFAFRYEFIPAEYTDNYGLFIKELNLGEFSTGKGVVKYIPPDDFVNNYHNHLIKATLSEDFSKVDIDFEQSSKGYYAAFIQPYLELMSKEQLRDIAEESLTGFLKPIDIFSWDFLNIENSHVADKPLILKAKVVSENLIDFAGEKYLFKIGELIGPQVELYSIKNRTQPLHDSYKREFLRKIIVKIPAGYHVLNPEELNIYADYIKDNEKKLLFESKYTHYDNTIEISINEYYDQVYFCPEEYEAYRKVVNCAADFNKKVLVIGKD